MRNIKFLGIVFRKDDESAIAKINVTNVSTSTGVVTNAYVDLFQKDRDATNGDYEPFIYWVILDPSEDTYSATVQHAGFHNPNCVGSTFYMQTDGFIELTELTDGEIEAMLYVRHEDHPSLFTYTLTQNGSTSLNKNATFTGDGVITNFILTGDHRASDFSRITKDGGTTWLYPNDVALTWGSNSPDYDDEIIHTSTGYFGVSFVEAPADGASILIEYTPKFNKAKVVTTIKQPDDGVSYVDYTKNIRLLDHGVEII